MSAPTVAQYAGLAALREGEADVQRMVAEADRLGWSFIIHRTDRPASELLLTLHGQLGAGREGLGINRWRGAPAREQRA